MQHELIDRHSTILEYLINNPRARTKDILRYLHDLGDHVGIRTVQRALEKIDELPGVSVVKHGSAPNHWYEIEKDETEVQPVLYSFLESNRTTKMFKAELLDDKSVGQVVFPDVPASQGMDWFPILFPAIKNRRQVSIEYHKFDGDVSTRTIHPYYLKQFRKRWYAVALDTVDDAVKTFALDRIEKCSLLTKKYKLSKKEDPKAMFENVIGLFEKTKKPERIEIWSESYNANYLRTLPLHPSQKELRKEAGGVIFELNVVNNYEFRQEILRMGANARVLSPDHVVEEMKNTIKEILDSYN